MKTNNNKNFIRSFWETFFVATIMGFLTVMAVKAESNLSNVLNGLFTPTQSERFFQAGREDFEREVEIFNYPERYLREDLLQIDPALIEQMNQNKSYLNLDLENSSHELHIDIVED